ncbi:MAG: SDR family oxidoreductase [Chloroflexota bacterium]
MFENTTTIITGGSEGLGKAAAKRIVDGGGTVWLLARNAEKLKRAANELDQSGDLVKWCACDVTSEQSVADCLAQIKEQSGTITNLINCAGIWLQGSTLDATSEQIQDIVMTNLVGAIHVTQSTLPLMEQGHIVNVVSLAGVEPDGNWSTYTASKYGLRGFTDSLRQELAGREIKVIGFYPGGIGTEFFVNAGLDTPPGQPWMMNVDDVAKVLVDLMLLPQDIIIEHLELRKF